MSSDTSFCKSLPKIQNEVTKGKLVLEISVCFHLRNISIEIGLLFEKKLLGTPSCRHKAPQFC